MTATDKRPVPADDAEQAELDAAAKAVDDAFARGYAEAWAKCSHLRRPPVCWVPIRARWCEVEAPAVVIDDDGYEWLVRSVRPVPTGLCVTIVGGEKNTEHTWGDLDPDRQVWLQTGVEMAEAVAVAGASTADGGLGGWVLRRASRPVPPTDPMTGNWIMSGKPI